MFPMCVCIGKSVWTLLLHRLSVFRVHSQYVAKLLQLLQGLLTPALLCRDLTATTEPSWGVWNLGPVLSLSVPAHINREGPAVKLQHVLLENRGGREEEEGPDDGEGALLEASRSRATETPMAVVLPTTELLQTT